MTSKFLLTNENFLCFIVVMRHNPRCYSDCSKMLICRIMRRKKRGTGNTENTETHGRHGGLISGICLLIGEAVSIDNL